MSTIIKSSRYYQGSNVLPALSSLTYGYTQYAARVVADGGTVINPTATQDAFNFLISSGLNPAQCVAGASFGVKKAGTVIQKLYSFDGNDFEPYLDPSTLNVEGPFYDNRGAYPVIRIDSSSGGYPKFLRTVTQRPFVDPTQNEFVWAMSGKDDVSADSLYLKVSSGADGSPAYGPVTISAFNNAFSRTRYDADGQSAAYNPSGALNAALIQTANGPAYADYLGFAAHFDITNNLISTFGDGVASGTKSISAGMYNYRNIPFRIYLGAYYANGPGYQKLQTLAEFWAVRGGSAAFALALSQRLGTIY